MGLTRKTVVVIVGARPNFMKAAPLFYYANDFRSIQLKLLHAGQHSDVQMSASFLEALRLPCPVRIPESVGGRKTRTDLGAMTGALRQSLRRMRPQAGIVVGDVRSTLAGALALKDLGIPLFHVEAGLRSFDTRMPEEANRIIVDHLSDNLFISEPSGMVNLINEGVRRSAIHDVGNVMIDCLKLFSPQIEQSTILSEKRLKPRSYTVATLHRQENVDDATVLRHQLAVLQELRSIGRVVFPIHPRTKKRVSEHGLDSMLRGILTVAPLGYFDFVRLMKDSLGVTTDSGGIQEESSLFGVPCCTLRDSTERPITVSHGTNRIFSPVSCRAGLVKRHIQSGDYLPREIPNWDGEASERILRVVDDVIV